MASKVYFMDDRYAGLPTSLPAKAAQLFDHAGLADCFEPGDSVAVKCHMGEWYNSAYLRPILIRAVVDRVKEHGGIPFVTDTTTAPCHFYGSRSTAQSHLETAAANGFTTESMGRSISISDGAYGIEGVRVENPDGFLKKEGYTARGVFSSRDMVAVDIAALDMADKAPGKPVSTAEEKEAMDPGSQKFTGTVGMSQWVTANTCARLGLGSKEYELVQPPTTGPPSASPGSAPGAPRATASGRE